MSKQVYKKISNIPNIGEGLFAGENIKEGILITEFKGKITTINNIKSSWSVISLYNDECIECNKKNLASYANDIIIFPSKKRNLCNIIEKELSLYNSYNNREANAEIYVNPDIKRAWLKSLKPINKDEEIFIHYGLPFWIKQEKQLAEYEDDLPNGEFLVPSYLFKSESFLKYTKIFYPKFTNIKYFENDTIVDISDNTDSGYNFSIDDIVGKNKNNILTL
jgi:hypothetical protein